MTTPLPAWGYMHLDFEEGASRNEPPKAWYPPSAVTDWSGWKRQLIDDLDALLWPKYNPNGSGWQPNRVDPLNDADFSLMQALASKLQEMIRGRDMTDVTHLEFFRDEDNPAKPFGFGYQRYDAKLPVLVKEGFIGTLALGVDEKIAMFDLQLKQVFQRPRPWQVAFLQARQNFSHREAVSANTPSFISGHCIQGSIGVCTVFATYHAQLSKRSIDLLKQFAVDIGDRRVFAGVHYPSDSLASWLTALQLIPCVFGAKDAKRVIGFLWDAIRSKSAVYNAIASYTPPGGQVSPYAAALEALSKLGSAASRSRPLAGSVS